MTLAVLRYPYVIAISPDLIEIRHVLDMDTPAQTMHGHNLRLLTPTTGANDSDQRLWRDQVADPNSGEFALTRQSRRRDRIVYGEGDRILELVPVGA
jgi:hypothetical protein